MSRVAWEIVPIVLSVALLAVPLGARAPAAETRGTDPLDQCNVVWETPSLDSSGSLPLGNGDIGLNVWVEHNGDLRFYLSKTDAWSENARLLKLGGVRISLSPNPFRAGLPFRQTLRLRQGEIEIRAGEAASGVTLRVWVDANQPVVRVEVQGRKELDLRVSLEMWRTQERQLTGGELFSAFGLGGGPEPVVVHPDTLVDAREDGIVWYHSNEMSCWPVTMTVQGLDSLLSSFSDPLLHRVFGGAIKAKGLVKTDATTLASERPRKRYLISVFPLTTHPATPEEWLRQLDESIAHLEARDTESARRAHRKWWDDFWHRSWIRVSGPATGAKMDVNDLPLRIGADSDGRNQFLGDISRVRIFSRAVKPEEIATLAQGREAAVAADPALVGDWRFGDIRDGASANAASARLPARIIGDVKVVDTTRGKALRLTGNGWVEVADDPALDLTAACTLEAWISPKTLPAGGGRIIDKSHAGVGEAYLLDTFPANSLRLINEEGALTYDAKLPPDQWTHVAATFDAAGEQRLYVNGQMVASASIGAGTAQVSQGYALQRFLNACGGRGAFPIKFNGSIFTVDPREPNETHDADYRRWGGPYWYQNTRLPYWAMLASGDFDLMQPYFRMYLKALPLAQARTGLYFGHEGAFFPETMYFWGTYTNDDYGWDRQGKDASVCDSPWIRYYWQGGLELTATMLDYYACTQDESFLRNSLLPMAEAILTFYDQHYQRDASGKLLLKPAQALETWQAAVNPLPESAGLRWVLSRLLALPTTVVTAEQRKEWERLLGEVPPLPTKEEDGETVLLPAQEFSELRNVENPELYAIFPYRLYGVGKPDLEVARRTFAGRRVKTSQGWQQDPIQAALLGLADEASELVAKRFVNKHPGSRFPAFWGPNFDWVPDQDNGAVALTGLQTMLMQTDGERILLFPAWPKQWDVEFKLHAPMNTTVEGVYRGGKLEHLNVTPKSRAKDVTVLEPQE